MARGSSDARPRAFQRGAFQIDAFQAGLVNALGDLSVTGRTELAIDTGRPQLTVGTTPRDDLIVDTPRDQLTVDVARPQLTVAATRPELTVDVARPSINVPGRTTLTARPL